MITSLFTLFASFAAHAGSIEDVFPQDTLDAAALREHLTAEIMGAPATRYDHSTRTAGPRYAQSTRVEALALGERGEDLAASDALRRFGDLALRAFRHGRPEELHLQFLAEHSGLAQSADVVGFFTTSDEDGAAEMLSNLMEDKLGDDDLRAVCVSLMEEDGHLVGIVVAQFGVVAFEPFERVVQPGSAFRIPGTVLDADSTYALRVTTAGHEVESYPIEGSGAFDLEFPLPRIAGRYRVSLGRFEKGRLPDNPFFFTLYAGVQPPEGSIIPDFGNDLGRPAADVEEELLDGINAERARYELPALTRVGDPQDLRDVIRGVPKSERAAWRYFRRELARDPLPQEPHGVWAPTFSGRTQSVGAGLWHLLQHPAQRQSTLGANYDRVVLAAHEEGGWLYFAATMLEPSVDAGSAREQFLAKVTPRWPKQGGPKPAPRLQAALDDVAERLASGKLPMKKFGKGMKKIFGDELLIQGQATSNALVVRPGEEPDTSEVVMQDWASHLAVGHATGDVGTGSGVTYAVLVYVMAAKAR